MCGIAGFILGREPDFEGLCTLNSMASAITHRGPDAQGSKLIKNGRLGLAHRRLSIIDLSDAGAQPMISQNGQYTIIYNGEIYNFPSIKNKLEKLKYNFRGHSDTEVLIASIEVWGLQKTLQMISGMFAFVLWNNQTEKLTLVRDRIGEKPLYYAKTKQGDVIFGSELGALRPFPNWTPEIDRNSIALYLRHSYIPAPYSIYESCWKLKPAHFLEIDFSKGKPEINEPVPYWSASAEWNKEKLNLSDEDAIQKLETELQKTVSEQMIADVPFGAFLSGGIDSSLITAMMQSTSSQPIKTFSIGFHEEGYNEAEHAKQVASHLGTDHTEFYVSSEEAMKVIPHLAKIYDEPFADSSQIPTYLVSKMAKSSVTVVLSGDGGDEIFAGYNRYFWAERIWKYIEKIPRPIRKTIAKSIVLISPTKLDSIARLISKIIINIKKYNNVGDKLHKIASFLPAHDEFDVYHKLVSNWKSPSELLKSGAEYPTELTTNRNWPLNTSFTELMTYLDLVTYLPGDILTKVDRAAMSVSLEGRIPFLDKRIVEYGAKLPQHQKVRDGKGKWILRELLYRHVPKEIIDRPKMGFGLPIDQWLRGPLKQWAEELLSAEKLDASGFFESEPIQTKLKEHLNNSRNWQHHLWTILMFQAWLEEHHNAKH